ncbi:MAG TPA: DUF1294 domain-containing protein [Rhodanobacteraceae bacterium]|nr:DUF1294 domain-containing protein [Rhodanobacteraceae bacterium]
MKLVGKISEWNDERGFGFIVPTGGDERAFLHVSAMKSRARRPAVGDPVTYTLRKDAQGRPQAIAVRFAVAAVEANRRGRFPRAILGVLALLGIAGACYLGRLPILLATGYGVFSVLSFGAYLKDKSAAKQQTWRTPESSLHLLDLLGGWPGALMAQQWFRHKTVKQPFQFIFWLTVAANLAGTWWLTVSKTAVRITRLLFY